MAERFFLIDGHAHLYQVFYAIRDLTAPSGQPVNAVYGFARLLQRIRREHSPQYLAVALDSDGKVFRHQLYEHYKANRKPMPEELARQLPLVDELLEVQGVPVFAVQGYEADDIMGTISRLAAAQNLETVLVTTDKDAEQLIDDHTTILHMHRAKELLLDREKLKETKGLEPWQVVELMALCGDPTDNVPGIPGIGPKTAEKLIREFGSVQGVYENIERIQSLALRQKLLKHRDKAELSRKLVTIDCNVPIELDVSRCRSEHYHSERLAAFYLSLDFKSLLEAETEPPTAPRALARQGSLFGPESAAERELETIATRTKDYSTVRTIEQIAGLAEQLRSEGTFAVDLETTSLRPREAKLVGLAFSWKPDQGVYVATAGPEGEEICNVAKALEILRAVLEDESYRKVGQNLKYDMAVLNNYGLKLKGLLCDTMVGSYLLNPSERTHGLDALAERYLNYRTVKIRELIGSGRGQKRMDQVPVEVVAPYACEDADVALQLSEKLIPMLKHQQLWDLFARLEMPLVPVLADMEWCGVKVDEERLWAISEEFRKTLKELEEQIFKEAGDRFNLNSPMQVSRVLFEKMGLPAPVGKRRETGYSTESSVLDGLKSEHPVVGHLLEYRELAKLKTTYADALRQLVNPRTGRVHASFNQTVTATGRLSSSDPNLQNIPVRTPLGRRIRSCFVPGEDDMSLLCADYSQVELRILAHVSGDERLREAFRADRDIHAFVASQIHGIPEDQVTPQMRQQAKAVNFGIIYGQKARGLSRQVGVSVQEAARFISEYFERYPGVKRFIGRIISDARRDGYVKTLAGRRRYITGIRSWGSARSAAERIAVNTVIQGSAADLIKTAMIRISGGLPQVSKRARMLLQIHDELVFEVPDAELQLVTSFVKTQMSEAMKLAVPLKVDAGAGKNWREAK